MKNYLYLFPSPRNAEKNQERHQELITIPANDDQPTKDKKKRVKINDRATMVLYETSCSSGRSKYILEALIAAIQNQQTVTVKTTGTARKKNTVKHHLGAKELARINTELLRCAHQILHDHLPNLAEEERLYALAFFKTRIVKNINAKFQTCETTIREITRKFNEFINEDKIGSFCSEFDKYIKTLLGLRDNTPIPYFEQLFIAAFLTKAAKFDQTSEIVWNANISEINVLRENFRQKVDAINDAIENSCAQHGMTRLLFENYLLENLHHFSIFTTSETYIPNRIKNIFNIFVEQLQAVWAILPESMPLWRRAHFLHTYGNKLFISSDAKITRLFIVHNAKLNNNPSIHAEFFSTEIHSNTAPFYLGPTGCKDTKELKHDLKQIKYAQYLEVASFTLGVLMYALAALSKHQLPVNPSNLEKNATMMSLLIAGTVIICITGLYDRAIRPHNDAALKITLSVFSKARSAQHYQPSHDASKHSNDIEAQTNPLNHDNNVGAACLI